MEITKPSFSGYGLYAKARMASRNGLFYQARLWREGYDGPSREVRLLADDPMVLRPYPARAEINLIDLTDDLDDLIPPDPCMWMLEIRQGDSHDDIERGGGRCVFAGHVMSAYRELERLTLYAEGERQWSEIMEAS